MERGSGAREGVLRNVGGEDAWHGAGASEMCEGGTETAGEQKEQNTLQSLWGQCPHFPQGLPY